MDRVLVLGLGEHSRDLQVERIRQGLIDPGL